MVQLHRPLPQLQLPQPWTELMTRRYLPDPLAVLDPDSAAVVVAAAVAHHLPTWHRLHCSQGAPNQWLPVGGLAGREDWGRRDGLTWDVGAVVEEEAVRRLVVAGVGSYDTRATVATFRCL